MVTDADAAASGIFWSSHHQWRAHYYHQKGDPERANAQLDKSLELEDKVFTVFPKILPALIEHTRLDLWDKSDLPLTQRPSGKGTMSSS